ncbi:hypothetical protein [Micromonospora sp. NPDC049662]|uniref:hypothetical protein n=1 Tax=unclassified Micromonospora TaxID=2617518 RepID=UPI003413D351
MAFLLPLCWHAEGPARGLADLVRDADLATILESRLNEAWICDRNGAYSSAVIMLGSLLEGVLLDAVKARLPGSSEPLKLIATASINFSTRHSMGTRL